MAGQVFTGTTQTAENFPRRNTFQPSRRVQQKPLGQLQAFVNPDNTQIQNQNNNERNARILNYQSDRTDRGYQYSYETENGIRVEEVGQIQGKGINVRGTYTYPGDNGQVYTVTYTADENGFRPQGDHLPIPPPIPEAISQSLQKNAQDQANGIFDDGKLFF